MGIPAYLLTRSAIGNTGALFVMLGIMLPAFLMAMYEKDGLSFEKVLRNIINTRFLRPGIRPYRTQNIYAPFTGCLLYTSDAADELLCVDLGGRGIIKKKTEKKKKKEDTQ